MPKSLKRHIDPIIQGTVSNVIAAIILGIPGCFLFIESVRNFPIPLWVVFILFVAWLALLLFLAKNHKQKLSNAKAAFHNEQSDVIAALKKSHKEEKSQAVENAKKFVEATQTAKNAIAVQAQQNLLYKIEEKHAAMEALNNSHSAAVNRLHTMLAQEKILLREAEDRAAILTKDKDAEITRLKSELETLKKEIEARYPLFFVKDPLDRYKMDPYGNNET